MSNIKESVVVLSGSSLRDITAKAKADMQENNSIELEKLRIKLLEFCLEEAKNGLSFFKVRLNYNFVSKTLKTPSILGVYHLSFLRSDDIPRIIINYIKSNDISIFLSFGCLTFVNNDSVYFDLTISW